MFLPFLFIVQGPVVVSRLKHESEHSLWKDLYDLINRNQIRMVLHIGNNVQVGGAQSFFKRALDEELSEIEATELFRERYRQAWNEPWTKHVLANVSNIMISNETDIGNMIEDDQEVGPHEWMVANASFNVRFLCYHQQFVLVGVQGISAESFA